LLLCAFQQCLDFGYELAQTFAARSLISPAELRQLERPDAWLLAEPLFSRLPRKAVRATMQLIPRKLRELIASEVERSLNQKNTARLLKAAAQLEKAA
jgi:hypothetical protein